VWHNAEFIAVILTGTYNFERLNVSHFEEECMNSNNCITPVYIWIYGVSV